ncbi:hypothetical protein ACFL6B_01745 [Thermodesulfobacteriota bacterium]
MIHCLARALEVENCNKTTPLTAESPNFDSKTKNTLDPILIRSSQPLNRINAGAN